MAERKTGATDVQIEAAIQNEYRVRCRGWEDPAYHRSQFAALISDVAPHLVPPGHRIISPEVIAAIREVLAVACEEISDFVNEYPVALIEEALH